MLRSAPGTIEGLVIAAVLVGLAIVFGIRQWREARGRDPDLAAEDTDYHRRQDRRRGLGSLVMVLLAVGMTVGMSINARADRASGRLFGWVWLGVATLVMVLLVLAFLDWRAIRGYARRHREALADERYAALEDERRRLAIPKNGRAGPHGPNLPDSGS